MEVPEIYMKSQNELLRNKNKIIMGENKRLH